MPDIESIHAHIYFDPSELESARALAEEAATRFPLTIGRFHLTPVGPHPRGSCQLTVPREQFGSFAEWLAQSRGELTVFAHLQTGNGLLDHTSHVIWFGPSETLNLQQFLV